MMWLICYCKTLPLIIRGIFPLVTIILGLGCYIMLFYHYFFYCKTVFSYQEESPKQLPFLSFHHRMGTGVSPQSQAAEHINRCTSVIKNRTGIKHFSYLKWSGREKWHSPAWCQPTLSASHWAQKHQPSLWWPESHWPAWKGKIWGVRSWCFWGILVHKPEKQYASLRLLLFFYQQSDPSISSLAVSRGPPCTNWLLPWSWIQNYNCKTTEA